MRTPRLLPLICGFACAIAGAQQAPPAQDNETVTPPPAQAPARQQTPRLQLDSNFNSMETVTPPPPMTPPASAPITPPPPPAPHQNTQPAAPPPQSGPQ